MRFGLLKQLVLDNGIQFTLQEEFAKFTKANGTKHICTTPYHPSSNGLANGGRARWIDIAVSVITTNQSPCSLLLKREVHTYRFDLTKLDSEGLVTGKQGLQKLAHDRKAKWTKVTIGQDVMARNYRAGDKWIPGNVIGRRGPLYRLKREPFWWRHIDQLREHLARADVDADTTSSDEVSLILL